MRNKWVLLVAMMGLPQAQGCTEDPEDGSADGGVTTFEASVGPGDAGIRTDSGSGPVSSGDANPGTPVDGGSKQDASPVATSDGGGVNPGALDAASGPEAGASEAGASEGGTTPSSTCPAGATLKAGDTTASLMVGGVKRNYLLHVPSSYTGTAVVPLVLDFHGLMSSGSGQKGVSGYLALSNKEGFIIAWPDGLDRAWNVGPCCTRDRSVDDVGFAKALVAKLKTEGCIDAKRVYATGFSMGGGMSHMLGCNAADVFAAIAPAAFDLLVEEEQPCKPARPLSVVAFRSSNDGLVKYAGGASTPPTSYPLDPIHFRGAVGSTKHWADLNMCTGEPTDTGGGCKTYAKCAAGVEVTLCTAANDHSPGDENKGWATLKRFSLP